MPERKRLADILYVSEQERLRHAWQTKKAADDQRPLPIGDYRFRILSGELSSSKNGTPGYKLMLEVCDGEHAGRRIWHDVWLSEAAVPIAKRDLGKLGIESLEQLEQPLPDGIIISARVALRTGDDGKEFNRVVRFEFEGVEKSAPEPFAPTDNQAGDGDEPGRRVVKKRNGGRTT